LKYIGVKQMSSGKSKGGGTGRGTGKKGWSRWQKAANKAKSNKPYKSKGAKAKGTSGSE
jgi:hypothetical protein